MIEKVNTLEDAQECDKLLNMLICDEIKYNDNINPEFVVDNWYTKFYLDDSKMLLVYKENNKIVGYIYAKINNLDSDCIERKEVLIDALYVLEEYRNRGIATKLIEKIKNESKEKKIKIINIKVIDKNIEAKKLYEKMGFNVFSLNLRCKV